MAEALEPAVFVIGVGLSGCASSGFDPVDSHIDGIEHTAAERDVDVIMIHGMGLI